MLRNQERLEEWRSKSDNDEKEWTRITASPDLEKKRNKEFLVLYTYRHEFLGFCEGLLLVGSLIRFFHLRFCGGQLPCNRRRWLAAFSRTWYLPENAAQFRLCGFTPENGQLPLYERRAGTGARDFRR